MIQIDIPLFRKDLGCFQKGLSFGDHHILSGILQWLTCEYQHQGIVVHILCNDVPARLINIIKAHEL